MIGERMFKSIKRTLVAGTLAVAFAVAGGAVVAAPAEATTPCVQQVYAIGNASTCVKHIQALVNYTGYSAPLVVDGVFGPATRSAVMEYQYALALKRDGIVGPNTWYHLCGALDSPVFIPAFPYANAYAAGCQTIVY